MHATGWSRGLDVTGGGTGVMSHAGLVLLRELADRTGLTAGLSAALPSPQGGHDRGRVFADLACAIADGARGRATIPWWVGCGPLIFSLRVASTLQPESTGEM
jgi:hypothetical protein